MLAPNPFLNIVTTLNKKDIEVKSILKYNKAIEDLKKNKCDPPKRKFFININLIKNDINKINEDKFIWKISQIKSIQKFVQDISNMDGIIFLEFCNSNFIQNNIPIEYIEKYLKIKYGKINKAYDNIMKISTSFLKLFFVHHLKQDLSYLPSINNKNGFLFDPLFRTKIRKFNLNDKKLQNKYFSEKFDLKKFVFKCIDKYFVNETYNWLKKDHLCHYYTLKIFLKMFEFGLWKKNELKLVLDKIYKIVSIMKNLEENIAKGEGLTSIFLIECKIYLTRIRKIIGYILIHMILIDFDYVFFKKMKDLFQTNLETNSFNKITNDYFFEKNKHLKSLFKHCIISKKSIYDYYLHIIITYISRFIMLNNDQNLRLESDKLKNILKTLYVYISNINEDLCLISLKIFSKNYFHFYSLKNSDYPYIIALEIKNKFNFIVEEIKMNKFQTKEEELKLKKELIKIIENSDEFLMPKKVVLENSKFTRPLLLTIMNIPQYILSLLDFFLDINNTDNLDLFKKGIDLLTKICEKNPMAQNTVFNKPCYLHFAKLFKKYFSEFDKFIEFLLGKDGIEELLKFNPEILELIYEVYKKEFKKIYKIEEKINKDNEKDEIKEEKKFSLENISKNTLFSLYVFNRIFSEMFEVYSNNRSDYEFYLAELISPFIIDILKFFKEECKLLIFPKTLFFEKIQNKVEKMVSYKKNYEKLPKKSKNYILYEFLNSFLDLFNRITKRFYTLKVYNKIKIIFEEKFKLTDFLSLSDLKGGIGILRQILRIFNNFHIFTNNHLLNKRTQFYHDSKTSPNNLIIPSYLFKMDISEQLYDVGNYITLKFERLTYSDHEIVKFFLCAYFPTVFKYYNGLMVLYISENFLKFGFEYEKIIDKIKDFEIILERVKDAMKNFVLIENNYAICQISKYSNQNEATEYFENYKNILNPKNNEFFNYSEDENFNKLRITGYEFVHKIIDLYDKFPRKKIHLKTFTRFIMLKCSDKHLKKFLKKKLKFNLIFRKKNRLKLKKFEDLKVKSDQNKISKFLQKLYTKQKSYYWHYFKLNSTLKMLNSKDSSENNVLIFVNYFFTVIDNLDLSFSIDNINKSYFNNTGFISLIILTDNSMHIYSGIRKTFFLVLNYLQKLDDNSIDPIKCFNKIWELHKDLFYFCSYKNFIDKSFYKIYFLYYLLSNFIQNLCSKNSFYFKEWFHQTIYENGKTYFQDYYILLQSIYKNSEISKNKTNTILSSIDLKKSTNLGNSLDLSDKPELFIINIKAIEVFNKFVNGSFIKTDYNLIRNDIDIWIDVIIRPVYDFDYNFNKLKLKVCDFILGLIESEDLKIINLFKSKFNIIKLYSMIIFIIRILFARQCIINQDHKFVNKIEREHLEKYKIKNEKELMNFYFKYKTFSDHNILNSAIQIYLIILQMSKFVLKYKNFIDEKNYMTKNIFILKKNKSIKLEEALIWDFLNKIIINIEVVNKNKTQIILTSGNKKKKILALENFYFKKLPICFFLTKYIKNKFLEKVNVDSLEEKHEEFFLNINQFKIKIKELKKLYSKSKILFNLSNPFVYNKFKEVLFIIIVIISIILLFTFGDGNKLPPIFIKILSYTSMVLSISVLILWFTLIYPIFKKIETKKYYRTNATNELPKFYDIYIFLKIWKNEDFIYFFLSLLLMLLGIFLSDFFYLLTLLEIFFLSKMIKNVGLSFLVNSDKIFYTFILVLVVINSYSYLLGSFYRNKFGNQNSLGPDYLNICDTYLTCFINAVNLGIRGGGGIAHYMPLQGNDSNSSLFYGKFVFDLSFYILVTVILLGMFFGVIVNAFADLRDKMDKRDMDRENICFTCGLDRYKLSKNGIDFDKHVMFHEIWKYLFCVIYLRNKNEIFFNGVELNIISMIRNHDRDWLPIGRTRKLENIYTD